MCLCTYIYRHVRVCVANLEQLTLQLGDPLLAEQQLGLYIAVLLLHALHLGILGLQP